MAAVNGMTEPVVCANPPGSASTASASSSAGSIAGGVLSNTVIGGTIATGIAAGATGVAAAVSSGIVAGVGAAATSAAGLAGVGGAVATGVAGLTGGSVAATAIGTTAAALASAVPVVGWIGAAIGAIAAAMAAIGNAFATFGSSPDDAARYLYELGYFPPGWPGGGQLLNARVLVDGAIVTYPNFGVDIATYNAIRAARYLQVATYPNYGLDLVNGWLKTAGVTDGTPSQNPIGTREYVRRMADAFVRDKAESVMTGDNGYSGAALVVARAFSADNVPSGTMLDGSKAPIHRAIVAELRSLPNIVRMIVTALLDPAAAPALGNYPMTPAQRATLVGGPPAVEAYAAWVDKMMAAYGDAGTNPVRDAWASWRTVSGVDGSTASGTASASGLQVTDAADFVWVCAADCGVAAPAVDPFLGLMPAQLSTLNGGTWRVAGRRGAGFASIGDWLVGGAVAAGATALGYVAARLLRPKAKVDALSEAPGETTFRRVLERGVLDGEVGTRVGGSDPAAERAFAEARNYGISPTDLATSGRYYGDEARPVKFDVGAAGDLLVDDGYPEYRAAKDHGARAILADVVLHNEHGAAAKSQRAAVKLL